MVGSIIYVQPPNWGFDNKPKGTAAFQSKKFHILTDDIDVCLSDPKFGQEEEFGAQHSLTLFMLLNQFQHYGTLAGQAQPCINMPTTVMVTCPQVTVDSVATAGFSWWIFLLLYLLIKHILGSSLFLFDIPTLGTVTSCPYHICTLSTINSLGFISIMHRY